MQYHGISAPVLQIVLVLIFVNNISTSTTKNNCILSNSKEKSIEPTNGKTKPSQINKLHNKNATFLSILTDSSSTGVLLIAEVVNHEVSTAAYTVHLMMCSDNIPVTRIELEPAIEKSLPRISNLSTKISRVDSTPPQRARVFTIDLIFKNEGNLRLMGKAKCLVSIMNRLNEKLATKLVVFSPGDSCICASSCACSCFKEDENLKCMSVLDEKEASDWLGRTNVTTIYIPKESKKETSSWSQFFDSALTRLDDENLRYFTLLIIIIVLLILLILGTCKGLCGICYFPVGRCGLAHFYDKPRKLNKYWEKRYSNYAVLHDSQGYPLNPITRQRTVQRLNPLKAFLLNVVFFLCCPIFFLYWLKDCCCKGGVDDREQKPFQSDHLSREPHLESSKSRNFGNIRRRSVPRHPEPKTYPPLSPQTNSNSNVRKTSIEPTESTNFVLTKHGDSGEEEEEEGEKVKENFIPVFHHSEPSINEQRYTAGFAHIHLTNTDSMPILTPIPDSTTFLQLTHHSDKFPAESHHLLGKNRNNGNLKEGPCCQGHPYGSWHRAPAIFTDDYDGDSQFDMHKSFEITKGRQSQGKDDKFLPPSDLMR